jgi:hypothetical protein
MKHRPILFSTDMVQAILEGRKTQTRRVVKPQPMHDSAPPHKDGNQWLHMGDVYKCPYGQPGDVLWVREAWAHTSQLNINSEDENYGYVYKADGQTWKDYEGWTWKPSIHMPRKAARLFLRIKAVRVERLQEISDEDAIDEGLIHLNYKRYPSYTYNIHKYPNGFGTAIGCFSHLWESINGPESWDANPWVWVVEFERITKEEAGL